MTDKEQLWYTRFLDYANSECPQHDWCKKNGAAQSTFRYWCNKFKACRADTEEAARLHDSDDKWYGDKLPPGNGSNMYAAFAVC